MRQSGVMMHSLSSSGDSAAPRSDSPPQTARPPRRGLRAWLAGLGLSGQFALVGSIVSLLGMLVIGSWVAQTIEAGVVRNSAISAAVYMESFIAPLSQELAEAEAFSRPTITRIDSLLKSPAMAARILSVKIWREGGLVAFATDRTQIGQRFPPADDLIEAWGGELSASFDTLDEAENLSERAHGRPLLEVYNPIHSIITGEVIAVAEFYLDATELEADLARAKTEGWALVAAVTLATFAALYGIVRAGSRLIAAQNAALSARYSDLAQVSAQNAALRGRVESASRRLSEMNEAQMRRISAELHDGPAQALALASLRLDALMRRASVAPADPEAQALRATLAEAMRDVRDICRGLTLPEIEGLSLARTLEMAVSAHERRCGLRVARLPGGEAWPDLVAPHPILICVYRFAQEGLMNAFRHAPGAAVAVACRHGIGPDGAGRITVVVGDEGPGFDPADLRAGMVAGAAGGGSLGLAGLRERVESIGGQFSIEAAPGRGTRLIVHLPLDTEGAA